MKVIEGEGVHLQKNDLWLHWPGWAGRVKVVLEKQNTQPGGMEHGAGK